ncbi:MAG: tRNA (N(6)-L-threonylcarbamoyladenosine(37)-C(2))-methylthiotransferase MtaB [Brevinematia bacterium]
MKFCIVTHGCKLNQFESSAIESKLSRIGLEYIEDPRSADIVIFNSCSVTNNADRKARKFIRQVSRLKGERDVVFIVTGCFVQEGNEEGDFSGVDLLVSNKDKYRIPDVVKGFVEGKGLSLENAVTRENGRFEFEPDSFLGRTRAFLKIQDGCDRVCSFCRVPFARGRSVSLEYDEVIRRFKRLLDLGYREIVITGVNITSYYWNGYGLKDLVKAMVSVEGDFRVRLSSIMPDEFDVGILEFVREGKLAPHLHLSMQSGSDRIIRKMRRDYTSSDLVRISEIARKYYEGFGLTGDVIVGFPGETEDDFRQTVEVVKRVGFFRLHIFPFSLRRGTVASVMPEQVCYEVKKEREKVLFDVVKEISFDFRKKFLGKEVRVLPEEFCDGGVYGYADNYLRVFSKSASFRKGEFCYIRVKELDREDIATVVGE